MRKKVVKEEPVMEVKEIEEEVYTDEVQSIRKWNVYNYTGI